MLFRSISRQIGLLKRVLKRKLWGDDCTLHRYILSLPGQITFTSSGTLSLEEEEKARRDILQTRMEIEGREALIPDILGDLQSIRRILLLQGRLHEAEDLKRQVLLSIGRQEGEGNSSSASEEPLYDSSEEEKLGRTSYDASGWTDITTYIVSDSSSPAPEKQQKRPSLASAPQSSQPGDDEEFSTAQDDTALRLQPSYLHGRKLAETPQEARCDSEPTATEDIELDTAPSARFSEWTGAGMRTNNEFAPLTVHAQRDLPTSYSNVHAWLLDKLVMSRSEVNLLSTILEANGVRLHDDTASAILDNWNDDGGRGLQSELRFARIANKNTENALNCIRKGGYDNFLIKQVIGYAAKAGLDGLEAGSADGEIEDYYDGLSVEGNCGDETNAAETVNEEMA